MAHVPLSPLGPTFHLSHLTAAPHSRCSWSQTPAPCSWFSVTVFPLGPPAAVEYFYDWFTPSLSIPGCSPGQPPNHQAASGSLTHSKASLPFIVPLAPWFPVDNSRNLYLFAYSSHIWLLSSPCVKVYPGSSGESVWMLSTHRRFRRPHLTLAHT